MSALGKARAVYERSLSAQYRGIKEIRADLSEAETDLDSARDAYEEAEKEIGSLEEELRLATQMEEARESLERLERECLARTEKAS